MTARGTLSFSISKIFAKGQAPVVPWHLRIRQGKCDAPARVAAGAFCFQGFAREPDATKRKICGKIGMPRDAENIRSNDRAYAGRIGKGSITLSPVLRQTARAIFVVVEANE